MLRQLMLVGDGAGLRELRELCGSLGIAHTAVDPNQLPKPAAVAAVWITEDVDPAWLEQVWQANAHVILDGVQLPGYSRAAIHALDHERLIVTGTGHTVTAGFRRLDLLDAHQSTIMLFDKLPADSKVLLQTSRVAGFDTAGYGVTEPAHAVMVEARPGKLVCALKTSTPRQRRFVPAARWRRLMSNMLAYVTGVGPTEVPEYPRRVPQPFTDCEVRQARYTAQLFAATAWYEQAGMLIDGDGKAGVFEGFTTAIDAAGDQHLCLHEGKANERSDCNIQSAFAFLVAGAALKNDRLSFIGSNIFAFSRREFQYQDHSAFRGLWRWFRRGFEAKVFYGDDNGWAGFFPLLWGVIANDRVMIATGLETAVALRNTWAANGHRRRRINWGAFFELDGRAGLRAEVLDQPVYKSPHYEATPMALMGLASWVTGDKTFIECCSAGLLEYVERWPAGIELQHAENDDGSKLIIALLFAFLATGESRYRDFAAMILQPFLDRQDPCGAIPEIDRCGRRYGFNRDNAGYGTFESSIFHHDGDPVTDQIYGSSFLALCMVFYTWVIKAPDVEQNLDKLLDYLCNIQAKQTGKTFLDGAWMRAFDYKRWEYFGAAGDWGWGPFAIETGWDVAIIMIATALRMLGNLLPANMDDIRAQIKDEYRTIERVHAKLEDSWGEHTPEPETRKSADGPDLMI